jgi:hypothetical protein
MDRGGLLIVTVMCCNVIYHNLCVPFCHVPFLTLSFCKVPIFDMYKFIVSDGTADVADVVYLNM